MSILRLVYVILVYFGLYAEFIRAMSEERERYKTKTGYRISGLPLSETRSVPKLLCTINCNLVNECVAINFIVGNANVVNKCQLFDFHASKENLKEDATSMLMEKVPLEKEITLVGLACIQSSRLGKFYCSGAIDGILEPSCSSSSILCAHTERNDDPWWQVDFGVNHIVTKVMIYNRYQFKTNLDNFSILIQAHAMPEKLNSNFCAKDVPYKEQRIRSFACEQPLSGRYLVVQRKVIASNLVLVEVRAFGFQV